MKFIASILAYLIMSLVLVAGIYQAVQGHFWLLAAGVIAYMALLIRMGCLPPSESH